MQTHIHKWGNSLGVRIPKQLAKQLHLHPGSLVSLQVNDGCLVIQTEYNLESMLKGITPKTKHRLLLDDGKRGGEEW